MKIAKQSVELVDFMGSDDSVANAARVSFAKVANNYTAEQNEKLINYLAKHNHWSPFAHCFLSFRIKAPIFVARQLVKHQVGLAWNEVSRRYVSDEPEFFFPEVWRGKPVNAKQGSSGVVNPNTAVYEHISSSLDVYSALLSEGVAPEQARMILPQNTMTTCIWSGSLMAFARVCKLRMDSHAQKETQDIAIAIHGHLAQLFPVSTKALLNEQE